MATTHVTKTGLERFTARLGDPGQARVTESSDRGFPPQAPTAPTG